MGFRARTRFEIQRPEAENHYVSFDDADKNKSAKEKWKANIKQKQKHSRTLTYLHAVHSPQHEQQAVGKGQVHVLVLAPGLVVGGGGRPNEEHRAARQVLVDAHLYGGGGGEKGKTREKKRLVELMGWGGGGKITNKRIICGLERDDASKQCSWT
jgi:hypothetical protein